MLLRIKSLFLVLCFTLLGISVSGAQQNATPANNPNIARIQQLKQEIQGLQKQTGPLYAQIQQLVGQIKTIKEQLRPLEQTMRADRQEISSLVEKRGKN